MALEFSCFYFIVCSFRPSFSKHCEFEDFSSASFIVNEAAIDLFMNKRHVRIKTNCFLASGNRNNK